ncbi:DUF1636 family protein [Frigidibacter sp. SD6-1]|uniref:DUF1636 family protein n=1 Tax=Frigidibacter sp. SD6-1 TaxID=3032581 RepID=UPI0024DF8A1F|nr:DUF1636 family protein [Frigidibacter sp. SD6-1]
MSTAATICASCPAGRAGLAERVRERLEPLGVAVREVDCMSGCARPSTLAFRAPGKVAYLFGEITEADLAEIEAFARLCLASADGTFPDARVLGGLRLKAIARIPG